MKNFIMNKKYLWINILLMFITYGIWIIVYFCLKSTYSKETTNTTSNNIRTWVLKISAVTFKNEDGTDRQNLIPKLSIGQELKLVPYKYKNQDAVYVETLDNKILGNIPAENTFEICNKISDNRIINVNVADINTFVNEKNKKVYYLKIKLIIKK